MVLKVAVKVLINTIEENGFVPACIIFGAVPKSPIISIDVLTQSSRVESLAAA